MGIIAFLSAISISAVAALYSILGLAAIFAGAKIPIMIMGGVLEVGKLVTASWLYQNWHNKNLPRTIKYYLTTSVIVLVFVTSMGIFGFLSKAHLDQVTPTTNYTSKITLIDQRILQEERVIERAEKTLLQLDKSIEVYLNKEYATRGLRERRKQEEERKELKLTIDNAMDNIDKLMLEKNTIELDQAKIEAEVGPIKYVAELIYGEKAQDNFDKSVRFVILILIFVFDPLAVLLLIAANISLRQWRKKRSLIKSEQKFNLEEQLDRERSKLKKVREKTRDYRKMMTKIGDFKDMSPDEIKVKLDQIYDWNDKTIK